MSGFSPAAGLKSGQFDQIYRFDTGFGLNVEHRTPNIERRILMTLRFIDFKTREQQTAKP